MSRSAMICLAFLISPSPLVAQPKGEEKPPQQKLDNDHVVLKAAFYEVDDAYYRKLVKATQWRSKADLTISQHQTRHWPAVRINSTTSVSLFRCVTVTGTLRCGE